MNCKLHFFDAVTEDYDNFQKCHSAHLLSYDRNHHFGWTTITRATINRDRHTDDGDINVNVNIDVNIDIINL